MHLPNEKPISIDGSVTPDEGVVFKPKEGHCATIENITFVNPDIDEAYELWVYKRTENGGKLILLYHFILNPGDRVEDNTKRFLTDQHEIVAKTNVANVLFSIEGNEKPNGSILA